MAQITIRIRGADKILAAMKMRTEELQRAAAAALYAEANNIMTASKRLVPVDLGALKASGYVTLPEISGTMASVELGYGGAAKEYAVIQHERTDFRHPDGGQAKFLQAAVEARTNELVRNIAALIKAAMATGAPPPAGGGAHPTAPK